MFLIVLSIIGIFFRSCLKARSGGDGWHCFFEYTSKLKTSTSVAPGVDVRNDGGYIVVEPSKHISGGEYLWLI